MMKLMPFRMDFCGEGPLNKLASCSSLFNSDGLLAHDWEVDQKQ